MWTINIPDLGIDALLFLSMMILKFILRVDSKRPVCLSDNFCLLPIAIVFIDGDVEVDIASRGKRPVCPSEIYCRQRAKLQVPSCNLASNLFDPVPLYTDLIPPIYIGYKS